MRFITSFINLENNPITEMIIDIAQNYPDIPVEESLWYILNNEITPEIAQKKIEWSRQQFTQNTQKDEQGCYFKPIILQNASGNEIYQCPICKLISGTTAPKNPENLSLFSHNINCPNKFKIPKENLE